MGAAILGPRRPGERGDSPGELGGWRDEFVASVMRHRWRYVIARGRRSGIFFSSKSKCYVFLDFGTHGVGGSIKRLNKCPPPD